MSASRAPDLGFRVLCRNLFRVKTPCDTDYDAPYASFGAGGSRTAHRRNQHCNLNNNNNNSNQHSWNSSGSRTTCVLRSITCGLSGVVGLGVLVIAGHVANDVAGPAIVSSLVIAAVSSLLSGLCYAEFMTRKSETDDSLYTGFYEGVGELAAFVIGWCLVLQQVVGQAVTGRALSALVDYLVGHRLSHFWMDRFGSGSVFTMDRLHLDPLAGFFVAVASLLFQVGASRGLWWSSSPWSHRRHLAALTLVVNLIVAAMFIVVGSKHTDGTGWTSTATDFLPTESSGLLSGAAICTFSFSAHYSMDFRVKSNRRPDRNIPLVIGVTLTTCFVLYFAVATVLTLITHRRKLDTEVPLVQAFELVGVMWAMYAAAVGVGFGLILTLLSLACTLCSSVISLATDGLLFRCIVTTTSSNRTSCLPSMIFGGVSILLAMTFPLTSLLEIIALPPLIINTLVCNCVLHQRYQPDNVWQYEPLKLISNSSSATSPSIPSSSIGSSPVSSPAVTVTTAAVTPDDNVTGSSNAFRFRINKQAVFPLVKQTSLTLTDNDTMSDEQPMSPSSDDDDNTDVPLLNLPSSPPLSDRDFDVDSSDTDIDAIVAEYKDKIRVATLTGASDISEDSGRRLNFPTEATGRRVLISVVVMSVGLFVLSVILVSANDAVGRGDFVVMSAVCVLVTLVFGLLMVIVCQPQNHWSQGLTHPSRVFRVPFLPWIPVIAIFINMCLLANILNRQWAPFIIWMIIGSGIYCTYGMWNSTAARQSNRSRRTEKIKLQPMPIQQPFLSSVLPIHNRSLGVSSRITRVDTIFISR